MKKKVIKEVKAPEIKLETQLEPKFHYLDEVIVVDGFYKGIIGTINSYILYEGLITYIVETINNNDCISVLYIKESELELLYCDCEDCDEEEKDEIIDMFREIAYENLPRYKKLFIKKTDLFPNIIIK